MRAGLSGSLNHSHQSRTDRRTVWQWKGLISGRWGFQRLVLPWLSRWLPFSHQSLEGTFSRPCLTTWGFRNVWNHNGNRRKTRMQAHILTIVETAPFVSTINQLACKYHIISRISKTAGNWSGCRLEPRSVVKMKQPGAELAVRVRSDPWEKNHRTGMTVMVQLKLVAWWIHSGFTHWIWWFNGILLGYPVLMTNGLPWYRWPIEIDGLQVYRS